MAYSSEKETTNPFLPKVQEKWDDFKQFDGDSIIENVVKSISLLIVIFVLVLLLPIGVIISIYNSFYNLQKKAYDDLLYDSDSSSSQFASSVELGIYALLSLPFLILLVPYWLIAILVTWFAKHKLLAITIFVLIIIFIIFRHEIIQLIANYLPNTDVNTEIQQ